MMSWFDCTALNIGIGKEQDTEALRDGMFG